MTTRTADADTLAKAARITLDAVPGARELHVEPTPEGTGYMLNDVTVADGDLLTNEPGDGFRDLFDALHPILIAVDEFESSNTVHVMPYGAVTIELATADKDSAEDDEDEEPWEERPRTITRRELIDALEAVGEDDSPVYLADCGYRSFQRRQVDGDDIVSALDAGDDNDTDPKDPDMPPSIYIKVGRDLDGLPGAIRDHFRRN